MKRFIVLILIFAIIMSISGCSKSDVKTDSSALTETEPSATVEVTVQQPEEPTIAPSEEPSSEVDAQPVSVSSSIELTDEQMNSIAMLNYLTVLTQKIESNSRSKVYLEEALVTLLNQIEPTTVDSDTMWRIRTLIETIKEYRMNDVKRARVQYISEQGKAQMIRSAIPNPLSILNIIQSQTRSGTALPVALVMAVTNGVLDSITSYASAKEQKELETLKSEWELDDAEYQTFVTNQTDMFDYMVRIAQGQSLPRGTTLNQDSVVEFVKNLNKPTVARLHFLKEHEQDYRLYGEYWLALAQSYYENEQYQDCLDAVAQYEALNIQIFRKDIDFAKVLPNAILAAREVMGTEEYIGTATRYTDFIMNNTRDEDWAVRYFVAQEYLYLYGLTNDPVYLEKAYDIALNNISFGLIDPQMSENDKYIAELVPEVAAAGSTKDQIKLVKEYNKTAKEARIKELPPVYEPLFINCELMFSLSKMIALSEAEMKTADSILHPDGKPLFLNAALDSIYWFYPQADVSLPTEISYQGGKLYIPVQMLDDESILWAVIDDGERVDIKDWSLEKVERKTKGDISTYYAVYQSPQLKKYKYSASETISVFIQTRTSLEDDVIEYRVSISDKKGKWTAQRVVG